MLLPCLQGESQSGAARGVCADSDESTWERARKLVGGCKVSSMWAASTHWYAEALGAAYGDVEPQRRRSGENRACERICDAYGYTAACMSSCDETTSCVVFGDDAARRRTRDHDAECVNCCKIIKRKHFDDKTYRLATRSQDAQVLWMCVVVYRNDSALALRSASRHSHCFSNRCGFIEQ